MSAEKLEFLVKMFPFVNKEIIKDVLIANKGNASASVDYLLELVPKGELDYFENERELMYQQISPKIQPDEEIAMMLQYEILEGREKSIPKTKRKYQLPTFNSLYLFKLLLFSHLILSFCFNNKKKQQISKLHPTMIMMRWTITQLKYLLNPQLYPLQVCILNSC